MHFFIYVKVTCQILLLDAYNCEMFSLEMEKKKNEMPIFKTRNFVKGPF